MKRRVYSHHKLPPSTEVIQNAVSHNLFVVLVKLKCIFNHYKKNERRSLSGLGAVCLEDWFDVCAANAQSLLYTSFNREMLLAI